MWWSGVSHSSLTRLSLSLSRWLTLGCVSTPSSLPVKLMRLLPVSGALVVLLGGVWKLLEGVSAHVLIYMTCAHVFIIYSIFTLCWFTVYRSRLSSLLGCLKELESTWPLECPVWRRKLALRFVFYWLLALLIFALWLCFVLVPGRYQHPNYLIPQQVPRLFRDQNGYWVLLALQTMVILVGSSGSVMFDTVFFVLMDSVKFFIFRINKAITEIGTPSTPTLKRRLDKTMVLKMSITTLVRSSENDKDKGIRSHVVPDGGAAESASDPSTECHRDTGSCTLSSQLDDISEFYYQVVKFADQINELSGSPSFFAHASTMVTVLTGSYITLMLAKQPYYYGQLVQVVGFAVYTLLFLCRICMWSVAGDDIYVEWRKMTNSLSMLDSLAMDERSLQRRQVLMERSHQPITMSARGYFDLRKSNILSILSFALTTFVILLQMAGNESGGIYQATNPMSTRNFSSLGE